MKKLSFYCWYNKNYEIGWSFPSQHRPFDVVKKLQKKKNCFFLLAYQSMSQCEHDFSIQFFFKKRRVEGLACTRKEINDNHTHTE
jgi:hypothetical protein